RILMASDQELAQQFLKELHQVQQSKKDNIGLTDIRLLVEHLTEKSDRSLYEKVLKIAVKIHQLKDDFSHIDADKVAGDYLPGANMRLEAVVKATENATHAILDTAQELQKAAETSSDPAIAKQINDSITKIYEACNFQDITGQHINKVVQTIMDVEALVKAIVKVLPEDFKQ